MHSKFTQKHFGYSGFKVLAMALILTLSTQLSFAQEGGKTSSKVLATEKQRLITAQKNKTTVQTTNDAGAPDIISPSNGIDAVCTTITGSFVGGEPTFTSGRLFRDGVASTCAAPKTCPGSTAVGSSFRYKTYTFTEPAGVSQCVTVTHTNTGAAGAPHLSIHSGPFDPTNICTGYMADEGGSPNPTFNVVSSFTIPANATVTLLLTETAVGAGGTWSITLDLPICAPLPPCSGAPSPGNTLSSANPVCPGINFTLSFANNPAQSGVTWQWQSSPDNITYTNIAGATSPTLVRNQAVATWYRCAVTCTAGSTTNSNPLQVTINPPSACYCTPIYTNGCSFGDYIANVTLLTLNNTTTCSAPPFTYYSGVAPPTLIRGGTYPVSVSVGPDVFGQFVAIWADYNQDGDFADPGEFAGVSGNAGASGTVIVNLPVPATALLGTTRMRVRGGDDVAPNSGQSCGASNSTFGEAEDYNITIAPCVNTAFTSQPANATVQCSNNATFTVGATGSAITYGWETRVNAAGPWQNVTNGGVYSGATTATLTITGVTSAMNGYQYRAITSNPCTAFDFSNVATLTVNPLTANVTPASATICTGSIQQLSITNITAIPVTSVFSSGAINIPVPDANVTGINHTIPVSGIAGVITDVSVRFSVPAHTWPGDLAVVLKSPSGQILSLDYYITGTDAGPGAGMVNTTISSNGIAKLNTSSAPYTGTFAPDAQLVAGAFGPIGPTGFQTPAVGTFGGLVNFANGTTANGNWTIAMYDGVGGDFGSLTNWQISFTYVAPLFATGLWSSVPAAPNTIFTDAAATIPYTGTQLSTVYVKPTVNTNYSVVIAIGGCVSNPTIVPVTVVNPVTAVVNPTNKSACAGGSTSFTVSASGGPLTYQWQVSTDGGVTWTNISGATSATLNLAGITQSMNNNRYRAIVGAAPCAGSATSGSAVLTVNALPIVTLSSPDVSLAPGQTTVLTASSTPAAAAGGWTWTFNGGPLAGTTNTQTVNVDGMGTYRARVVDINGCVGTSNDLVIGAEASDRLWIYPNPTGGQFQVRLFYGSDVAEKRTVTIYNQLGQVIQSKAFELGTGTAPYLQMNFDLGHVARGIYVVKVAHQFTGKVVSGLVIVD
jgi:subtilisin-like proprotein convertase family protein